MIRKNLTTKKWFGNWANEYDQTLGKLKRHHKLLDLVVESSRVQKDDKVLDVGCGTGLLSLKYLKKTNCFIFGIDSSAEMLSIFKKKIKKLGLGKKITCKLEDVESLNFNNHIFDIIASTVALHHVKNKYSMIKKIHKLLKTGGKFVLGDIDMDTTGKLRDPKRLIRIIDCLKNEFALAI